ncbi:transposase [Streptomyces sp. NPDC001401]|uniref:transposase n=1 Tax=Streptomyces sp. NPDC001401 TaxID=3364570 RepID=UPI0036B299DD
MGRAGTAVAEGQEAGPATDMDPAAADRGIHFRVRTGIPWRDIPEGYGPWGRAYDPFRRWQRNGTWQRIFTQLQTRADAKDLITWDLNIDSTVCRAHQHAAGARKRGSCRRSRPAASPPSPVTTDSGARAAD